MSGSTFVFKQFKINQDRCGMKVGTDAVLLGSWTDTDEAETILDIGTGTGIIALMLAQRSNALIDAIDVEESACSQAVENVEASPWSKRIKIQHIALQAFAIAHKNKYDLIVSNPPYFIDSSKAEGIERSISRHTDLLPFDELASGVVKLLKPAGKFCVILPVKEGNIFRAIMEKQGLHLTRLLRIKGSEDKPTIKRLLMQFEFVKKPLSESTISIEKKKRHHYTEHYKILTQDYYLSI